MEVTLKHLGTQADFYDCEDSLAAFVGGLGSGKTMTASDWIINAAAEFPDLHDEIFIFSNTYAQLQSGTLRTLKEQFDKWGCGPIVDRVHYEKKLHFPGLGGSVINVRSADGPIKFKSLEIHRAWIDEAQAYPEWTWQQILGRRRGSDKQRALYPDSRSMLRLTANPPHSLQHWLARNCTIPNPKTGKPPITLFQMSTYENPFLSQEYIDDMESTYDSDLADIELRGQFGNLGTGKVWRAFDRRVHVLTPEVALRRGLPPLEYDPRLPLCWGQDFNLDPLSTIFFQWRKVNVPGYRPIVMYVLGEMRIRNSIIDYAVKEFVENRDAEVMIARRNGIRLYGDASGGAGNRQTGVSDWAALINGLERNGFRGTPFLHEQNPRVRDRYNAGNAMLVNANGDVGTVIHARNVFLPLDLEAMVYRVGTQIVDEKKKLKDNATVTHSADAWSYPIEFEFPVKVATQNVTHGFSMR